jgi:hypothetical protein
MTFNTGSLDMADCYGLDSDDLPDDSFLVLYTVLDRKHRKDKTLLKQAQTMTCAYSLKKVSWGSTTVCLLCLKDKIVMLTSLTK